MSILHAKHNIFKSITMLCGKNFIFHIMLCEIILCGILFIFNLIYGIHCIILLISHNIPSFILNMRIILYSIVGPTKHCYGSE